ncbi:DUF689-domain-containing protein [Violaceomyces palustris]|uniref:DUF689-domain-containing protein n=1 Tax=Violaceomyces palustris TaxID=1673888 RepID=A0ACD0P091_9BASI|nr:DUF689-domain-containing protein [Violaceomyces palustris]
MADNVLVIGSMQAAQSGAYQRVVEQRSEAGKRVVEMHMADRLTDGATALPPSNYPLAHLVVPYAEASSPQLLSSIYKSIKPAGQIIVEVSEAFDEASFRRLKGELAIAGFLDAQTDLASHQILATKSSSAVEPSASTPIASSSSSSSSTSAGAAALPLRRKLGTANGADKAKKAALWAVQPASENLIDQNSLLSASDLVVPSAVKRPDCDVGEGMAKKKKACKGCTCGLKELQEAEMNGTVVQLDDQDMDMPNKQANPTGAARRTEVTETVVGADGVKRTIKRVQVDTKGATSSCGSCFLGDAFRCSSCPFLGLPAFEPGQKVEIPQSMDDDIEV